MSRHVNALLGVNGGSVSTFRTAQGVRVVVETPPSDPVTRLATGEMIKAPDGAWVGFENSFSCELQASDVEELIKRLKSHLSRIRKADEA